MLVTFVLVAHVAWAESIPYRWQLRLVPDNLPSLPADFYRWAWASTNSNGLTVNRLEDYRFRAAAAGKPAEVLVTAAVPEFDPKSRTAPLAVHRCLVEFDQRLHTAQVTEGGKPAVMKLGLSSAVELPDRVWYQVMMEAEYNKGPMVVEWRLEFGADPRTEKQGPVTVRGYKRVLTEAVGEEVDVKATFRRDNEPTHASAPLVIRMDPDDRRWRGRLPGLHIADPGNRHQISEIESPGWATANRILLAGPSIFGTARPTRVVPPGLVRPPKP